MPRTLPGRCRLIPFYKRLCPYSSQDPYDLYFRPEFFDLIAQSLDAVGPFDVKHAADELIARREFGPYDRTAATVAVHLSRRAIPSPCPNGNTDQDQFRCLAICGASVKAVKESIGGKNVSLNTFCIGL